MRAVLRIFAILATLLVAGCFSGDEPVTRSAVDTTPEEDPAFAGVGANATVGQAFDETNRTTGSAHIHDYWEGRNRVELADAVIRQNLQPFPSGRADVNEGLFHANYEFPHGTIVFEGTGKMEIVVTDFEPTVPGLKIRYLTPNAKDWSEFIPLQPDIPLEIGISPRETDMPHAVASGWAFNFYADGGSKILLGQFRFLAAIYKSNNVEVWPAHPDFYPDGLTHRIVLDKQASTTHSNIVELNLYDQRAEWVRPERLISMGTERLAVFVNVTNFDGPPGLEPTAYYLEYKNATGHRVTSGTNVNPAEESPSPTEMVFHLDVDDASHDSAYGEESRWGFRMRARFAGTGGLGMPHTIHFGIVVIAYPFPA